MGTTATIGIMMNGLAIAIAVGALVYSVRTERRRQLLRLEWADVAKYARDLASRISRGDFRPDLILASAGPSVIVAQMLTFDLGESIPVYVLQQQVGESDTPFMDPGAEARTRKWRTLIPECCYKDTNSKVLVVHDVAGTGNVITAVREVLVGKGLQEKNVRTAAAIALEGLEWQRTEPDFFGTVVRSVEELRLPWGHHSRRARLAREPAGSQS